MFILFSGCLGSPINDPPNNNSAPTITPALRIGGTVSATKGDWDD